MKLSDEALKEHRIALAFGAKSRSSEFASLITEIIDRLGITELLDYGCGNGELAVHLKPGHSLTIQRYDPANEEFSGEPVPMQMVVCIDVLHVLDGASLNAVLEELQFLTGTILFIVVDKGDKTPEAWFREISSRFEIQTFQALHDAGCYLIVFPRNKTLIPLEH